MSAQLLLGLGIAIPLVAIGGYVAWLGQRVEVLEERVEGAEEVEDAEPSPRGTEAQRNTEGTDEG